MIKKFFVASAVAAASVLNCFAQENVSVKKFDQYAGVQANQLLRQLLNLSNNNTAINNPYLITYAIHLTGNGYGLQGGFGFNYQLIHDKIPVERESKIKDLFYRIGVGRKVMIARRWQLGCGLDFTGSYQMDKTTSSSMVNFGNSVDSSSSVSTSKTTSSGGGVQAGLGFYISDKIILGTEATYYYSMQKIKQNVFVVSKITDFSFPQETTYSNTNSNSETVRSDYTFSVPAAIFLIVKF